jgi:hypothetical protein
MRVRAMASVALVVLAGVLVLAGAVAYYGRAEVVRERAFADRAVAALEDDAVREVASREIVVNLIDRGSTDLVAGRPLLESVVDAALATAPFQSVVREAARVANRALFVRGGENVAFDLSDAAELVEFGMRSVSPRLAREVPEDFDATLVSLRRQELAAGTLEVARDVRVLGLLLPPLALAALVAAVALAPDRRVAVLRGGVAVGAAGTILAIALVLVRARLLAGLEGSDELTDEDVRQAAGGVFDAYLGDLSTWAFALGLLGLVVAAAAMALDPARLEPGRAVARLPQLLARPAMPLGRTLWAAAALVLGIFAVANPALALDVVAIAGGACLVFVGAGELLALIPNAGSPGRRAPVRALATAGLAGVAAVGAAAALIAVATGGEESAPASATVTRSAGECNGSADLCELRLNEVVFAGTHNSFSAADDPGWSIANQRRTIPRQLQDGIRLFLIDTHWGVEDANGRVRTDFEAEARNRNRVAAALPPAQLRAAERLAGRLGARGEGGEREVWLCHSVCELGARRLVDALADYRSFLERSPGEVVILFVEPYVAPAEFAKVAAEAGIERYIATLDRDEPLPTLGELVRANRRIVVFAEQDADGSVPWYLDGFSVVQDTPLGATTRDQLSCARYRGTADSPLLMLNHWADLFPPRLRANRPFLEKRFILERAHRCARERGQPVNLIAADHYDQGELIAAVRDLNGEQVRAVRRERDFD